MTRLAEFEVYLRGYDYYSPLHTHAHTNHTLFSGEPQWSWGLIQYEGCSRWLCSVQFKVASGQFDPDLCLLSAPLIVLPATHTHTHTHTYELCLLQGLMRQGVRSLMVLCVTQTAQVVYCIQSARLSTTVFMIYKTAVRICFILWSRFVYPCSISPFK